MGNRSLFSLLAGVWLFLTPFSQLLIASDHDDGEMELKGRNVNLTDLYVFREDWQDTSGSDKNLVVIVNTNPRSLARQAYYFSTMARYDIHFSRVGSGASANKKQPTGNDDVILRFTFGSPTTNSQGIVDSTCKQPVTINGIHDGVTDVATSTIAGTPIYTTDYNTSLAGTNPTVNSLTLGSSPLSFFGGLRQDPFFFDVTKYFQIRNTLATTGTTTAWGGLTSANAVDFTTGYNVNAIAVKVPITYLQSAAAETTFDVWTTISIPQ